MALQMQAFGNFTPAMFKALADKIHADTGVDLPGISGTVNHGSFTFSFDYNEQEQLLHIQCLKKPLFIPASTIINGLNEEVQQIRSAAAQAPTQEVSNNAVSQQETTPSNGDSGASPGEAVQS